MACCGAVGVVTIVTLAVCILTPRPGAGGRAFNFQPTNQPSTNSKAWLMLQPPAQNPILSDLSVCLRYRINFFREKTYVFSYATSDKDNNEMNMGLKEYTIFLAVGGSYRYGFQNMSYVPDLWYHACFVVNGTTVFVYLDGELQQGTKVDERSILQNGSLVLGQETDLVSGGFQEKQSFCGIITDFNLYSRALSPEEVEALATCSDTTEEGDVVAWSTAPWTVEGDVVELELEKDEYCVKRTRFTVFPELRTITEAKQWCVNLKSRLAVTRNAEENERLYGDALPFLKQCRPANHAKGFFWLAATDEAEDGIWTDYQARHALFYFYFPLDFFLGLGRDGKGLLFYGDVLNYTNFMGTYKASTKNCALFLIPPSTREWEDGSCKDIYQFCSACEEEAPAVVKMRGLCEREDAKAAWFTLHQRRGQKPTFRGFTKYLVEPGEEEEDTWRLVNQWTNQTLAKIHAHNLFYPVGLREWQLTTDYDICGKKKDTKHFLSLSTCLDLEYTCGDGSCVNLSRRCDLRTDCPDNTDEIGCDKLQRPKDYLVSLTPAAVQPGPLTLNLSLNILGFSEINLRDLKLTVDLATTLSWYDQRLSFRNLKAIREINHIPTDEVWTPKLEYTNADFPRIFTTNRILNVMRETEPEEDDPSSPKHEEVYLGRSNSLLLSQRVNAPFTCNMDLRNFPFDTQHCTLLLRITSARNNFLTWGDMNVSYMGETLLTEYEIGGVLSAQREEDMYSVAVVQVTFYRRFWFYVTSAYLPTVMLMMISYASLWCKPENSDLRVMMSLTTLLVLYALYQQISDGLPRTSYTKALDVWCFFAITLIFTKVIFHVFLDAMSKMKRRRHVAEEPGQSMWAAVGKALPVGGNRLMVWARGAYAVLVILFVIVYWTVVLSNMNY
ncbi:Gamma-aminobutyric acid receptor subunit rho-3 [Chionoecetes opilio]|uniref:Gamma-aminobutyric acid receptor subunit rho-3 n=1 Tax=Chionoecetes opilio TaxID=41210 RepID=A0A8J5D2F6_CHIOP|nr:Gamma-aminobutyric acid receptor subunit rho-3 [Chionoecetes opilio]